MNKKAEEHTEKFAPDAYESAELKLAILKENFEYQEFFEKFKNDPYCICQELRKPDEKLRDYHIRILTFMKAGDPYFGNYGDTFGINDRFLSLTKSHEVPLSEVLILFDPNRDLTEVSPRLTGLLPLLFHEKDIRELDRTEKLVRFGLEEKDCKQLSPYERILLVDLRKRKTQLMGEFENLIDKALEWQKIIVQLKKDYPQEYNKIKRFDVFGDDLWETDTSRQRKEAREQLEVWKLRKQKKNFWWISKELGITEDLAKKRFYRAYKLTQRESYDPDRYRKEGWKLRKSDLLKTCGNCKDKKCLEQLKTTGEWNPCPHILRAINQDQVPLKEKYLKEGSDSYRDSLFYPTNKKPSKTPQS